MYVLIYFCTFLDRITSFTQFEYCGNMSTGCEIGFRHNCSLKFPWKLQIVLVSYRLPLVFSQIINWIRIRLCERCKSVLYPTPLIIWAWVYIDWLPSIFSIHFHTAIVMCQSINVRELWTYNINESKMKKIR